MSKTEKPYLKKKIVNKLGKIWGYLLLDNRYQILDFQKIEIDF